MSRLLTRVTVSLLLVLLWAAAASAIDYRDYIGFRKLETELGSSNTPTGAGVIVTQAEAGYRDTTHNVWVYLPDHNLSQFSTNTFTPRTLPYNWDYSIFSHATDVGSYFYGNTDSIAPGITSVNNYMWNHWLENGFLNTGYAAQPLAASARVANHSWVAAYTDAAVNVEALKRLDWVISRDEYIQVVAMNNGSGNASEPLLGSSFNAIAVGRSDGGSKQGSCPLDSLYTTGRTRPDLVAPLIATSYATPVVGAAAALLVQVGHTGGATLSTDPAVQSTTNRNGDTIFNAERSEVVKAALMAGASRTTGQLTLGYTIDTNNGLNSTYGAGQLNIYNSYHIIAAGEHNSLEDGGTGHIGSYGFDYDPYFGGSRNSNRTASYSFTSSYDTKMAASLVWNLAVGTEEKFDDSATFYHLGLYLYDLTNDPDGELVGQSVGQADNTENLWLSLYAGHNYLLQVSAITGDNFLWDYGLAWDLVPVPGTVYLLGTGFLVLVGFRRKLRS